MSLLQALRAPVLRLNGNGVKLLAPTVTARRHASDDKSGDKKKVIRLPHHIEHATGFEKLNLLAEEKGIEDPFCYHTRTRGPGTKDNPNLVPTFEDKRFISCICEEDQTAMVYMWVHMGEPKRCKCGYWFKAVPARKFWEEIDTSMGI